MNAFSKAQRNTQIIGTQFASGDHSTLEHKTPYEGLTEICLLNLNELSSMC